MVPDWIIQQIGPPPTDPKHYGPYQSGEISWEEIPQEIKDRWREWNRQEEDIVVKGLEKGNSLEDLGYQNKPDQGKSMFARFGPGGFFSEYGANVDPGWVYDWASGRKYNKGTSDKYANGELGTRWEPISSSEYQGYRDAQRLKGAGLNTYGQQATAASFNRIKGGHFTYDPKSGNYYNVGLGSGNDPSTWEWVDPYGRKLNNYKGSSTWLQEQGGGRGGSQFGGYNPSRGGSGYGVSAFGGAPGGYDAFGGGGYGADPMMSSFGGGIGPWGKSPGEEATYWGQANLNNVMAESMRNDILAQQLQLQKGLEGRALGGGVYDYLLNEVYGPVLGAQFKGNDQGVSNFVQQQQQQIKQPTYGTEWIGEDQVAKAPPQPEKGVTVPEGQVGKEGTEFGPRPEGGFGAEEKPTFGTGSSREGISGLLGVNSGFNGESGPAPTVQGVETASGATGARQRLISSGFGRSSGEGGGIVGPSLTASGDSDAATMDKFAQDVLQRGRAAKVQAIPALQQRLQQNPNDEQARRSLEEIESDLETTLTNFQNDIANGNVPKQSSLSFLQDIGRIAPNSRSASLAQQLTQQINTKWPQQTGQGVGVTQSTGTPLPKGSYTQTGTQALDPNMSNTWARFLAPTWGKINEAAQSQQQALAREMPRGGEADRAQSQAINQRYGMLQQGWQQMVPQALQGISDIGKEMYFQQPMGPSGAMQTAANQQLGMANLAENKRQFNTSRQDAKDAQPSFLERLGGGLSNYVQGNMQAGGQAMMSMSDEKAKKDVAPFRRSISELRRLDPVSYNYNGKFGSEDGLPGVSVMAQQLERIMPEAVVEVKTPDGPVKYILPSAIQMATVNAVKDLDRKISDLSRRR